MLDPTQPARLGNIYDAFAFKALSVASSHQDAHALIIDREGTVAMIGTEHPEYGKLVQSTGFACFLSAASDPARLASRLQAAHQRVMAH